MVTKESIIKTSDLFLRKAIYECFNGRCFYSGQNIRFEDMHIDHIVPKKYSGKDCIENYVLCSQYINNVKTYKTDNYFQERMVLINKLIFVDNVVRFYNELSINADIINRHTYSVDMFCKENKMNASNKTKVLYELKKNDKLFKNKYLKTTGKVSSKNRLFAKLDDLEFIKKKYNF